jgi:AcrR family transcriptional regulator
MSDRQTQIVDTAIRLLATKGARRFTVQLLATEIGVTGGAIYRHFASMEGIVDAVVERMGDILFEGFPPEDADPLMRLGTFFHHRTRTIVENPHLSRLLLSDHLAQASGRAQAERLDEYKRRSRGFVIECLREAERAGALAEGTSSEAGAALVLGSILSLSHAGTLVEGEAGAARLSTQVWTMIERALRGPCPAGASKKRPRQVAGPSAL